MHTRDWHPEENKFLLSLKPCLPPHSNKAIALMIKKHMQNKRIKTPFRSENAVRMQRSRLRLRSSEAVTFVSQEVTRRTPPLSYTPLGDAEDDLPPQASGCQTTPHLPPQENTVNHIDCRSIDWLASFKEATVAYQDDPFSGNPEDDLPTQASDCQTTPHLLPHENTINYIDCRSNDWLALTFPEDQCTFDTNQSSPIANEIPPQPASQTFRWDADRVENLSLPPFVPERCPSNTISGFAATVGPTVTAPPQLQQPLVSHNTSPQGSFTSNAGLGATVASAPDFEIPIRIPEIAYNHSASGYPPAFCCPSEIYCPPDIYGPSEIYHPASDPTYHGSI
jgi:hypothetical protein